MKLDIRSGKYIVAVSGGVDSVVLLHFLVRQGRCNLVVAHFDHGIRKTSAKDAQFVEKLAQSHNLPFELGQGALGEAASEDQAREYRYQFLKTVLKKHEADGMITAHHQDDLIESALLNLLRGSNRRGLSAIKDNPNVIRPLLGYTKQEIIDYAKAHKLQWAEDETNDEDKYLRNYIRHNILPKLAPEKRASLLIQIDNTSQVNLEMDSLLAGLLDKLLLDGALDRYGFTHLPVNVSQELLAYWLRQNNLRQYDKKMLQRLNLAIRTARPGAKYDIYGGSQLEISDETVNLLIT